jgi:hypothetical protein
MLRRDGAVWRKTLTVVVLVSSAASSLLADERNGKASNANDAVEIEIGGKAAVEVVDEDGKPVEGCTLIGMGLRSHQDPSTGYGWTIKMHGPHAVAVTDAAGQAELPWPRWVVRSQQVTTAKISVMADHPDFCLVGHQDVDVAEGATTKITLKQGGRLRLHAFRPGEKKPLTDFRAQISGHYDSLRVWQNVVGGPAGRVSPAMEAGPRLIRLIQPEEDGSLLFSDLLRFESKVGVVEDRLLKLKPAMTVRGQLSENVPRPVRNGFVVAVVADQIDKDEYQAESLEWQTWRPVSEDGTFEVDKLPPSDKVRLLAFCDGYVSRQPEKDDLPRHLQRFAGGPGTFSLPQFFNLVPSDGKRLTVQMEEAATCRLKVVDGNGKPIEGVTAGLSPNVMYSSGSTIFGMSLRSEDAMFEARMTILDMLKKWQDYWPMKERGKDSPVLQPVFHGETDADGAVVIRNLPPRSPQGLFAQHEDYVPEGTKPPYRLMQQIEVKPGETSEATIRMVPKPPADAE